MGLIDLDQSMGRMRQYELVKPRWSTDPMDEKAFGNAPARWVIVMSLVASMLPVAAILFLWPEWARSLDADNSTLGAAAINLVSVSFLGLTCWYMCQRYHVTDVLGLRAYSGDTLVYLALGVPMVGASVLGFFVLYVPLVHLNPDLAEWLLGNPIQLPPWDSTNAAWTALLISIMLVIVAPSIEEVIFRGFLLHRWRAKYGTWPAIWLTSVLFGILHGEIIGHIALSVFLCLIVIRSSSLVGPILVHMGNNGIAVLIMGVTTSVGGSEDSSALTQVGEDWWLAAIGGVVSIPWLTWYARTRLRRPATAPLSPS